MTDGVFKERWRQLLEKNLTKKNVYTLKLHLSCFKWLKLLSTWCREGKAGLSNGLASGSVYVLTICCIVINSSDRAAAGFWEVECMRCECICMCVCLCVHLCFVSQTPTSPLFPHSTSAQRNVWSTSYAGWMCQHSWLDRKGESGKGRKRAEGPVERLKLWDQCWWSAHY